MKGKKGKMAKGGKGMPMMKPGKMMMKPHEMAVMMRGRKRMM